MRPRPMQATVSNLGTEGGRGREGRGVESQREDRKGREEVGRWTETRKGAGEKKSTPETAVGSDK